MKRMFCTTPKFIRQECTNKRKKEKASKLTMGDWVLSDCQSYHGIFFEISLNRFFFVWNLNIFRFKGGVHLYTQIPFLSSVLRFGAGFCSSFCEEDSKLVWSFEWDGWWNLRPIQTHWTIFRVKLSPVWKMETALII